MSMNRDKAAVFDADLYEREKASNYLQYANDDASDDEPEAPNGSARSKYPSADLLKVDGPDDPNAMEQYKQKYGSGMINTNIASRENEYQARRLNRQMPSASGDAFAVEGSSRGYREIMIAQELQKEEMELKRAIAKREQDDTNSVQVDASVVSSATAGQPKRRRRWDDASATPVVSSAGFGGSSVASEWNMSDATPMISVGGGVDATPVAISVSQVASRWDATPTAAGAGAVTRRSRWDATPAGDAGSSGSAVRGGWDQATPQAGAGVDATPLGAKKRSRWDETPVAAAATPGGHGQFGATPGATPSYGALSLMAATPNVNAMFGMTPEAQQKMRWEAEVDERNRPLSDEELDAMFPPTGYRILTAPASYIPIMTPHRKLLATPTPYGHSGLGGMTPGFNIQQTPSRESYMIPATPSETGLPGIKPEDIQYFGKLLDPSVLEEDLSVEELKERKILKLLLKIKNGTPPQRKTALKQITEKAVEFGAEHLFNQILPLLMSPTLEDQERHLLVKVIDRIMYKLGDLVRPYVHKVLIVIEPLLIDEDYFARVEGREIISNLAKAAGLNTMVAVMRPDIDNPDEYVRNTTARAFAVIASALSITAVLPFLQAVCASRKSWQARHTGIKIVQQIAILMGAAVLPHLKLMVMTIEHGLVDEQQKVRTITALSLAALAEAAFPYGIEAFDSVLRPLWKGIRQHRGKGLAAFLKAIGYIIPLMDTNYASYYTKEVMVILIREFQSPDEEIKKIVLKAVMQCVNTDGVEASYVKEAILPEFFRHFWVRRMALDRRNYKQVVETTVAIASKVGCSEVVGRIVSDLKDESEPYRKMVMEAIELIIQNLGAADIDTRLEEVLIDGIIFAFVEQVSDDTQVILTGFGCVVNALGERAKPYFPQICGQIKWRLNNKSAKVRMQASDIIARIAPVMRKCNEDVLMGHLGGVLYEYLGEEYPEVLGSILGALKALVNVVGMTKMNPPIKDLLPRLTPILKNRHEKVQENCIDLVGRIADRGAEYVSAREWMRICFELLDMLKAHKKAIRRAAINTFGYIAKAIGPQDVLHTLLNNLKVQERQMRVCTTVAVAIVAETCSPFTVLPALLNEYRIPDLNVQNGVLKAISFLFEYIGEMGKDYIYAVAPLLEDALADRDLIHRQTAMAACRNLALGVVGLGCEDVLVHLLNFIWPNIFEESQHVIFACMEAIEGMMVAVGPLRIMCYVIQGLYHPARFVRDAYWKIYNSLYIYAADALTAGYPRLEHIASHTAPVSMAPVTSSSTSRSMENSWRRTHLELFV